MSDILKEEIRQSAGMAGEAGDQSNSDNVNNVDNSIKETSSVLPTGLVVSRKNLLTQNRESPLKLVI